MPAHTTAAPTTATLVGVEPQLFTTDLERSCDFYRHKLGFSLIFIYGEPAFYAQVGRGAARLNLKHVDNHPIAGAARHNEGLLSATLNLSSPQDIKDLFLEFQAAGVHFQESLKQQPWGAWNFIVDDPDGNLLLFAGPAD